MDCGFPPEKTNVEPPCVKIPEYVPRLVGDSGSSPNTNGDDVHDDAGVDSCPKLRTEIYLV